MNRKKKTIIALSTPPGKSAIALIRVSGSFAYMLVSDISKNMPKETNIATLNEIIDENNKVVDQTVTTFFKAPKSFTGEDVVELSIHGGEAILKKIFTMLLKNKNTRIAIPGEFTRRAFENNKLDLTQVEAIADLVNAQTELQRKQAISHLSGEFFGETKKIFNKLKKILANLEAIIDFSEEDLPDNLLIEIREQIKNNIKHINNLLKNRFVGMSIRDGFLVAIIGKPNTGKSSFINCISGKDLAIVTDIPGTTRDLIESFLDLEGYPVRFVDTAGIRKPKDPVEKIGIKKALEASKEANVNIVFVESEKDIKTFKKLKNPIFVKSKQDINKRPFDENIFYNISSKTRFGISKILRKITKILQNKETLESISISRERHAQCLFETLFFLEASQKPKSIDIFAEDIRQAVKSISGLFGGLDIEDILDIIFSDFCIGK